MSSRGLSTDWWIAYGEGMRHMSPLLITVIIAATGCGSGSGAPASAKPSGIETIGTETERSLSKSMAAMGDLLVQVPMDTMDHDAGTTPLVRHGTHIATSRVALGSLPHASAPLASAAIVTGTTSLVSGRERGALLMEPGSRIDIPVSGLVVGQSIAFAAWINPTGDGSIFELGNIRGSLASGYLTVDIKDPETDMRERWTHAQAINHAWHHVAIVMDGARLALYVDGVKQEGPAYAFAGGPSLVIAPTHGLQIDDVRLYGRALTSDEVRAMSVLQEDLVGHWMFNELGSAVQDASGYGNHATTSGSRWPGRKDIAGWFDGIDDACIIHGSATLAFSTQVTVSAWVQVASTADLYRRIVSKKRYWDTADGFELEYNSAAGFLSFTAGGINFARAEGVYLHGGWHHVVGVISDDIAELYVDGIPVTTDGQAGIIEQGDAPLVIGQAADPTVAPWTTWHGGIDDVRIFDRVLTPAEIEALSAEQRAYADPYPFTWVRKILSPSGSQASAVARNYDAERIETISRDTDTGIIRMHQWSGDALSGYGYASNTLVAPWHTTMSIRMLSFDIQTGTLQSSGTYLFNRRTSQDTRLRLGYRESPLRAFDDGMGTLLGGMSSGGQLIMSLPMRWTPPGTSSGWQTGNTGGIPEQAGVWLVAPGSSLSQAQKSPSNLLWDMGSILVTASPSSGQWQFGLNLSGKEWSASATHASRAWNVRGQHGLAFADGSPLHIATEAAGGSRTGQLTTSDVVVGWTIIPPTTIN